MKAFFLLLLLFPIVAFAQEQVIKGRLIDSLGEAAPGCTILISGTQRGVASDVEGNFILSMPSNSNPFDLEISFIGYIKIKVKNIHPLKSINLGSIELVSNVFLTDEEVKKLSEVEKYKLVQVSCNGILLGYQGQSRIEKRKILCPLNLTKEMVLNYDSVKNEVIIPYSQIISCQ